MAGSFLNATNGSRLGTLGGEGSFLVNYDGESNNVILSDFLASVGLMGDYNGNDMIETADYTVWRDALTADATSLANDPTPGTVDESDFLYCANTSAKHWAVGPGPPPARPAGRLPPSRNRRVGRCFAWEF